MFRFLYNLGILLYYLSIKAAGGFNEKAKLWIAGRKNIFRRLKSAFTGNHNKVAWFHCASLGEFEQARPVIEGFREKYPHYKILLSFFSPSGYEIRKNYAGADYIFYLPIDTRDNARQFLDITTPSIAFFVKYEFWFHYISELRNRNIPAISFSAIFRPGQIFFKPIGAEYKELLKSFNRIFVQDTASYQLLHTNGFQNHEQTGDTRFDRVVAIAETKKRIPVAETFKNQKLLVAIGSAWPEDLKVFLPVLVKTEDLKIIIAPHEITESIMLAIEHQVPSSVRFSKAINENLTDKKVLIIDNIGMLSSLYYYSDFACIGGAFGKGLHNTLEAAVYGQPLFFGPNYTKFKEAKDLIHEGAAWAVKNEDEFKKVFYRLYSNETERKTAGLKASEYVKSNTGATEKILKTTGEIIK